MQAKVKNFVVDYSQEQEFNDLKREIFGQQIYYFETEETRPVIIDAGAHIGLTTLYFKWLYPEAKILAFEPNPKLFHLLEKNVAQNELTGVTLVNKALGKHEDQARFYVDETDWQWYSTGSMIKGAWNGEQKRQKEITVATTRLERHIRDFPRVDLLKLDIEGKEMAVILSLKHEIEKIKRVIFEYHDTREQNLAELLGYLKKRGLGVQLKDRKNRGVKSWHEGSMVLVEARRDIITA